MEEAQVRGSGVEVEVQEGVGIGRSVKNLSATRDVGGLVEGVQLLT